MPFKSKAQRRKFAELLVNGKITEEAYEEWNRSTGGKALPERIHPKKPVKSGRTRKAGGKTKKAGIATPKQGAVRKNKAPKPRPRAARSKAATKKAAARKRTSR